MSERWARAILTAYRFTGAAAYPFIGGYIAWRTTRGKEERSRRRERYGFSAVARPPGPLVWVHAASVGESNAVIPLVRRIADFAGAPGRSTVRLRLRTRDDDQHPGRHRPQRPDRSPRQSSGARDAFEPLVGA